MVAEHRPADTLSIGGVPFPRIDYDGAIDLFGRWIAARRTEQVCVVNVHTLVTARRDPRLAQVFSDAGLNTLDGQPLRWYANWVLAAGIGDRVCGPELMARCLDRGRERGWRHYLLGGRETVLESLQERLAERYPGIQIAGASSPPFRPLTVREDRALIERINASGADLLWVGLGAPKQEFWIADHRMQLQTAVNIGVGAAFDFLAGQVARAPAWMQRHGLEWAFRLYEDPRLWRRYLSTNPAFLWLLLRDLARYRVLNRTPRSGTGIDGLG